MQGQSTDEEWRGFLEFCAESVEDEMAGPDDSRLRSLKVETRAEQEGARFRLGKEARTRSVLCFCWDHS